MSLSDLSNQASSTDLWKGCGRGFYAYDFRVQLTTLAKDLRGKDSAAVFSRFNEAQQVVEFVTSQEEVIAVVTIIGAGGEAYSAEVQLKDMSQKANFETALQGLVVKTFEKLN